MRLPLFRVIGDNIKDRFDGASRIMVSNSLRGSISENAIQHHGAVNLQTNSITLSPNSIANTGRGRGGRHNNNHLKINR